MKVDNFLQNANTSENNLTVRKWIKLLPILLIEAYVWFSYFLYRYGPWKWPFRNDNRTLLFLLFCNSMLFLGYFIALKLKKKNYMQTSWVISPNKVVTLCTIVSILLMLPMCKYYTGHYYPPIIQAISNPYKVYYEMINHVSQRSTIRFWGFFDVFIYCLFPLITYYWDRITIKIRILGIITSFYYLLIYMSSGKNIHVFILLISVLIPFILVACTYRIHKDKLKLRRTAMLFLTYSILMIAMFKINLTSRTLYSEDIENKLARLRMEEDIYSTASINYNKLSISGAHINNYKKVYEVYPIYTGEYSWAYVNPNDKILNVLPVSLRFTYTMASGYLTNGYHGLTVSLYTEHQWTYGLGHSSFLMDYFNRIFGIPVYENSYYYRLSNEIKPQLVSTSMWPSAYTQFADDLTFLGVIFLMFFMGFVLYFIWIDAINGHNIFAILLLSLVAVQYLFLPANNFMENSGGNFVTFYVIGILWVLTKFVPYIKKRNLEMQSEK